MQKNQVFLLTLLLFAGALGIVSFKKPLQALLLKNLSNKTEMSSTCLVSLIRQIETLNKQLYDPMNSGKKEEITGRIYESFKEYCRLREQLRTEQKSSSHLINYSYAKEERELKEKIIIGILRNRIPNLVYRSFLPGIYYVEFYGSQGASSKAIQKYCVTFLLSPTAYDSLRDNPPVFLSYFSGLNSKDPEICNCYSITYLKDSIPLYIGQSSIDSLEYLKYIKTQDLVLRILNNSIW